MLRTTRVSAALIRSLILGTATMTAAVSVSSVLIGCEDDTKPDYWVEKLDDPKWRPRAVKRLTQFLDDALGRADNNHEDPAVLELEQKLVEPLTKVYVESYDDLDTKTRVTLIKLLADFRDEKTIPALKAAFDHFAKRPRKTKDEADIKWAVRAYGDMKSKELAPSVLAAFKKLKASTPLGMSTYRDYSKAMVAAPSDTWTDELIDMLKVEMKHPRTGKTKQQIADLRAPFMDQQFWQVTAAQVLGAIKDPKAVDPLIEQIVDPAKGAVGTTAILALVKIGEPSVTRASKLFNEDDPMVDYAKKAIKKATDAKEEPKGNPIVGQAAAIIGVTGRADGVAPLLKALQGKLSDEEKTLIARELPKLPVTDEAKAAFKKTFESISLDSTVNGTPALVILAESSAQFYEPGMIDWMLERARKTRGSGDAKIGLQQTLATSALKLAGPKEWDKVPKAAKQYKVDDLSKVAEKIVKACGEDVNCYLKEIEKGENQNKKNQFAGLKAGYMIGVLGDAAARDKLVEGLAGIENGAITFVALQSIDHLAPEGAPEIITGLEELVEKNEKAGGSRKGANSMINTVIYRVSVRGS